MLLRVMQVAEEQGITRSSVFLVLDPLYAPTPSPAPARHHARRSQARRVEEESSKGAERRFQSLGQLALMAGEAARAVMVLAPATRGPAAVPAAAKTSSSSPSRRPSSSGGKGHPKITLSPSGAKKSKDDKGGIKELEEEERERGDIPPPSLTPRLNQSASSEVSPVMT